MSGKPVIAPSARLLRFMRSQNEDPTLFSSNHQLQVATSARRAPHSHGRRHTRPASHGRCMTTAATSLPLKDSSMVPSGSVWSKVQAVNAPLNLYSQQRSHRRPASLAPKNRRNIWSVSRWLGVGSSRRPDALESDDLPPLATVLDDSSLSIARTVNEQRLRCTEYDEHGNATIVHNEFKKTDLIAKASRLSRDGPPAVLR